MYWPWHWAAYMQATSVAEPTCQWPNVSPIWLPSLRLDPSPRRIDRGPSIWSTAPSLMCGLRTHISETRLKQKKNVCSVRAQCYRQTGQSSRMLSPNAKASERNQYTLWISNWNPPIILPSPVGSLTHGPGRTHPVPRVSDPTAEEPLMRAMQQRSNCTVLFARARGGSMEKNKESLQWTFLVERIGQQIWECILNKLFNFSKDCMRTQTWQFG
jgi:hypothetical protein